MEFDINENASRHRKFFAVKSTQTFLVGAIILLTLVITIICIGFLVRYEVQTDIFDVEKVSYWQDQLAEEQKHWYEDGIEELKEALEISWELKEARNVIVFMTHGIGEAALAAVRFDGNKGVVRKLAWEEFSHVGQILTNCTPTSTCDAFSFGTALFGGVQTTLGLGGLDTAVPLQNCTEAMNEAHHIKSILDMAMQSDFRTGFVTTRRVSGPLMSALYAHSPDTNWECDSAVPAIKQLQGCKDIATQFIDDEIGVNINVVMGGGRQTLISSPPVSTWDPIDPRICNSRDGRNYIRDWRTLKRLKQQRNAVLQNAFDLKKLNGSNVDFVLGVFANGNIPPSWQRNTTDNIPDYIPELSDMVEKALEVLNRKKERFLLIVESGNGSEKDVAQQIQELQLLNVTMHRAMKNIRPDTLLVALFEDEYIATESTTAANSTTKDSNFEGISGNIKILATGPSSYLFNGLFDDTYIAHAVSFAFKIGPYRKIV